MSKKKVIIATPHVWDSPYRVGSHQYAKCFSDDGWEVAYISAPITPFHILYHLFSKQRGKVLLPQRWSSYIKGGKQVDNIWMYVPFGLVPVANQFPFNSSWAIENAGRFLFPSMKEKLRAKGFEKVHTIWLDSPLFGYLLDLVPHEKSVLRVADELSGFPELGKNIIETEMNLAGKVDLVVVTARSLEEKVKAAGAKKILFLPNGVDSDHFTTAPCPEPEDLKEIKRPRIIYVGSIERWFNERWIEQSALNRKDLSFVIIGNYERGTFPSLERLSNVFFLGKRAYAKVPSYLKHSETGIIPFKKLPFIDSVNPIKLYEYMACGLPVVSTKWKTLEEMKSPALLAETEEEFMEKIETALKSKERLAGECIRFAGENNWAKRLELVKKYL